MSTLLNQESIDELIPTFLRNNGVLDPPDVDWSVPIIGTIKKLARQHGWSESTYEQVLTGVTEDILMGENLDTGYEWKQGTLAQQVRLWLEHGKDEEDIRYIMGSYVRQKAITKARRLEKQPGDGPIKTIEQEGLREDDDAINEDRYEVSDRLAGLISQWLGEYGGRHQERVVNRDAIEAIDRYVDEHGPDRIRIMWSGYLDSHDKTVLDIGRETIRYRYDGSTRCERVQEALDRIGVSSIYYVRNQLQEWLLEHRESILDMMCSDIVR